MLNQIQIPNEMPKQVRHDEDVILNSLQNLVLNFDIHLTFACLCEAASANAGILKFGFILSHHISHKK